jgi:Family of unknown function (DUF5683)
VRSIFSIFIAFLLLSSATAFAQDEIKVIDVTRKDSLLLKPYTIDPLAPGKAAFYSAILPGLGQIYNKRYWKLPLVYGGMGLSFYYYSFNNNKYHQYRNAYKNTLAGRPVTGQLKDLTPDRLISGQKFHQRNRDLSLLITVGIYILNIVDANVDAHLKQFNVNENLSLQPALQQNQLDYKYSMGFSLNYKF